MKTTEQLFKKYPYIVANGQRWGSDKWYVEKECREADNENAPIDSYYKSSETGKWVTVTEIPEMKKELDAYIRGEKGGILR